MLVQDLLYGRDTFSVELMQMAPYEWGVSVLSYRTVPYHVSRHLVLPLPVQSFDPLPSLTCLLTYIIALRWLNK